MNRHPLRVAALGAVAISTLVFVGCPGDQPVQPTLIGASSNAGDYFYAKQIGAGALLAYSVATGFPDGSITSAVSWREDRIVDLSVALATGDRGIAVRHTTKDSAQRVVAIDTSYFVVTNDAIVEYRSPSDTVGRCYLRNPLVIGARFREYARDTGYVVIDSVAGRVLVATMDRVYGVQTERFTMGLDSTRKHVVADGWFPRYGAGYFIGYSFEERTVFLADSVTPVQNTLTLSMATAKYP